MWRSMSATDTYSVKEVFYSLQGEGFHTGKPAVFVRFAGCNLRCPFCDTDFTGGETMTRAEIVRRALAVLPSGVSAERMLLVLTGGEPSLQADDALADALHEAGFYIAIETNGTHALPDGIDWITCSPKDAPVVLTRADELKVVYRGQDVETLYDVVEARHHFLQPCDMSRMPGASQKDNLRETIAYILAHPRWRLSIQMHKTANIR